MKKKRKLIISIVIVLIILFMPLNKGRCKDGGTVTYTALSYKLIIWHQLDDSPDGYKTGKEIHFFPNNFHDINYYMK